MLLYKIITLLNTVTTIAVLTSHVQEIHILPQGWIYWGVCPPPLARGGAIFHYNAGGNEIQ